MGFAVLQCSSKKLHPGYNLIIKGARPIKINLMYPESNSLVINVIIHNRKFKILAVKIATSAQVDLLSSRAV